MKSSPETFLAQVNPAENEGTALMTNAVQNVWRHADAAPESLALREGDRSSTYAELRACVRRAAEELRQRGVGRDDRVLMVVPTSAEFVFVYHGALSLGATAVTVNPLSTAREIEYFLTDSESTLAVGDSDSQAALLVAATAVDVPTWLLEPGAIAADPSQNDDECAVFEEVRESDAAALLYRPGPPGVRRARCSPTATCSNPPGLYRRCKGSGRTTAWAPRCRSSTSMVRLR